MNSKNFDNGKLYQYIRRNIDEAAIVAALAAVGTTEFLAELSDQDQLVLAALRRANHSLSDATVEEIQSYLSGLDEEQIPGLVSNVKGIVHEMEFVRLENEDGDSVYASMFEQSNHPDTDVNFVDAASGATWEVQLKATDNVGYVQDWIDTHPDGEILVTSELAEEMNLPSSGQTNEQLTASVQDFVDKMVESDAAEEMWDYFPALSVLSVSIIVFELWRRYQRGEINSLRFKQLVALATGLKVAKIAAITFLLTIPVVGQVTGALLIANLLLGAKSTWFDSPPLYVPPPALPA